MHAQHFLVTNKGLPVNGPMIRTGSRAYSCLCS